MKALEIKNLTKTYKNNAVEKPKQNNLEKKLLQENPILIIL